MFLLVLSSTFVPEWLFSSTIFFQVQLPSHLSAFYVIIIDVMWFRFKILFLMKYFFHIFFFNVEEKINYGQNEQ